MSNDQTSKQRDSTELRKLTRNRNEFFAALLMAFAMVRLPVNSLEWKTVDFDG